MKNLLLLFVTLPLFAADPAGFNLWKGGDFKSIQKNQALANYGNHNASVTFRNKDGVVEVHRDWNDVLVVQAGEATLLIGGTPVDPKETGPGETRAPSATGAEKRTVGAGDIIHIPAGVAHQFMIAPGTTLTYVAIKIPAK